MWPEKLISFEDNPNLEITLVTFSVYNWAVNILTEIANLLIIRLWQAFKIYPQSVKIHSLLGGLYIGTFVYISKINITIAPAP